MQKTGRADAGGVSRSPLRGLGVRRLDGACSTEFHKFNPYTHNLPNKIRVLNGSFLTGEGTLGLKPEIYFQAF